MITNTDEYVLKDKLNKQASYDMAYPGFHTTLLDNKNNITKEIKAPKNNNVIIKHNYIEETKINKNKESFYDVKDNNYIKYKQSNNDSNIYSSSYNQLNSNHQAYLAKEKEMPYSSINQQVKNTIIKSSNCDYNSYNYDENKYNDLNAEEKNNSSNNFEINSDFDFDALFNDDVDQEPIYNSFIPERCLNYKDADYEWRQKFPWDLKVENALFKIFNHREFRTNQREVINAALSNKDVFVCMPTGGGKSMTYQLPAYLGNGLTVVIMPLVSLMLDQYTISDSLGIKSLSTSEEDITYGLIKNSMEVPFSDKVKILYTTPEKIYKNKRLMDILTKLYYEGLLTRFVIDEAHCMSKWGNEFREDYLKLGELRNIFPNIPILALTATATKEVREEVIDNLHFNNGIFFSQSFNRPNLYIEIKIKDKSFINNLLQIIRNNDGESGIIYTMTQKRAEQLTDKLQSEKVNCDFYHGGMNDVKKRRVQNNWKLGKIKIVIATCAFGMGINKENVRFVIHDSIPKSFENYYQEIGRAGRDNLSANCILFYSGADKLTLFRLCLGIINDSVRNKNVIGIYKMIEFVMDEYTCRKKSILNHFDEKLDHCYNCDNCKKGNSFILVNKSSIASSILTILTEINQNKKDISFAQLINLIKEKKSKSDDYLRRVASDGNISNTISLISNEKEELINEMLRYLIINEYIIEEIFDVNRIVTTRIRINLNKNKSQLPNFIGIKYLSSNKNIPESKNLAKLNNQKNIKDEFENDLYDNSSNLNKKNFFELYTLLCDKREELLQMHNKNLEEEDHKALEFIFTKQGLRDLVTKLPTKEEELTVDNIFGVSKENLSKYGPAFLKVILKFCETNQIDTHKSNIKQVVDKQIKLFRESTNKKSLNRYINHDSNKASYYNNPNQDNDFFLLDNQYNNENNNNIKSKLNNK